MEEVPIVLAKAPMTEFFLDFLQPDVFATLNFDQLCDALHTHVAAAPERSLATAHRGRGLILARTSAESSRNLA